MAGRRTIVNIREAQMLWIAVILLGTVINYFAITLLNYYEESVPQGLPNFDSALLNPPQRKLSRVAIEAPKEGVEPALRSACPHFVRQERSVDQAGKNVRETDPCWAQLV